MTRQKAPSKLSYPEFLAWCDEDTRAEWVEGEVIMLSPASRRHQEIFRFLSSILGLYVQARDLGTVLTAPFQMYLEKLQRGREPDLLFISKDRLPLLKETYLDGPADLVIEIVSPESQLRDQREKRAEYAAAGIKEYWLIDPDRQEFELNRLDRQGRYHPVAPDPQGFYPSEVLPGFKLKTEWLWQEPLPSPLKVLAEITGADPQIVEQFERALRG